jgi:hypothetical protein
MLCITAVHTSGGNSCVNALKLLNSSPILMSGQFNRIDKMACVAHALLMTWLAKKRLG